MARITWRFLAVLAAVAACSAKKNAPPAPTEAGAAVAVSALPAVKTVPINGLPDAPREGSAVVPTEDVVFVADEDANAVVTISADPNDAGMAVRAFTKLAGRPGQMIVSAQHQLAVALRDEHAVGFFERANDGSLVERRRVSVADEPVGLARVPGTEDLVSVSAIGSAICVVKGADAGTDARCFTVAREPRAVTVSDDGRTAIVAHATADSASVVTLETGAVKTVGLGRKRVEEGRPMESSGQVRFQRFATQGFAAVRLPGNPERIAIPHSLSAPGDRQSTGNGYGPGNLGSGSTFNFEETMTIFPVIEFDIASVVGPAFEGERKEGGILGQELTDAEGRCFLPRAAIAREASIFVACLGSSEVQRYDVVKGRAMKAPSRFALPGVTALAIDARGALLAFSQHERRLAVFDTVSPKPSRTLALDSVPAAVSDQVRRGRVLFHAARNEQITNDRRACATCHPDGRDDGLTWTTPEGPRQTIFLAGRLDRKPPFGWQGKDTSIGAHVKSTLRQIGGAGLADDAIADLEAFVRAIPAPPRRSRPLSADAERGRQVFASSETRCSTCHAEKTAFGGNRAEDVGSKSPLDTTKEYLVPSLLYVGASPPYYHDGRYATLDQLIRGADANPAKDTMGGSMGHTKQLSDAEVHDLAAYLGQL
jgi:mono/diheme cytochrome c family protein